MSAVARRYARAAVEAAAELSGPIGVDALVSGLKTFSDLFRASLELRELLTNPGLHDQLETVLDSVLAKLALSAETVRLVRLLAVRARVDLIDEVLLEAEKLADEHAERIHAYVTSPSVLTDAQTHRIAQALEHRLGRAVVVSVALDPDLLGGLVCRVGDLTLDSSLRRELMVLREELIRPMS